jgi:hypothetical protein
MKYLAYLLEEETLPASVQHCREYPWLDYVHQ